VCILKTAYLLLYSCSEVIKINHLNTSMVMIKLRTYCAYFGKFLSSLCMYIIKQECWRSWQHNLCDMAYIQIIKQTL
jgi:hypothetical protein